MVRLASSLAEGVPQPHPAGVNGQVSAVLTDAAGHFVFPPLTLVSNTQLRVSTLETPPVRSPVAIEILAVRVTMHVRRSGRPGWARFYGTVAPAQPGATVKIQLSRPHHAAVTLASTTVKGGGAGASRFSALVRVRHAGLYRALVKVLSCAQFSNSSHPLLIG